MGLNGPSSVIALLMIVMLAGCAEKGPIQLQLTYLVPAAKASPSNIVVGVSPFKDARDSAPSAVGTRTIPSGQKDTLFVHGTISEAVTAGLKKALVSRGIAVKDAASWDLSAGGMRTDGFTLQLGGEIKILSLETTAASFTTHVKAAVQLKIAAADVQEKKIIRTINVSSETEQDILYSREKLESALSGALTVAIDQLFKDEEMKKRFK